jgi:DNA repair exonuclease SbcCD nuclease subunit
VSDYILVNDIHLSDRAPKNCTDSYLEDLFGLLDQIARLAQSRDAPIIFAGDIFHIKTPSRTSHATVLRLIEWAREALVPVWAVPGNHDLLFDRFDSLSGQPLGVCFASGAIQLLDGWPDTDEPIYGVPWLATFDDTNVSEALRQYRAEQSRSKPRHTLVVTHAPLYPPGRELPYENYPAGNWITAMGTYLSYTTTVHYGHVHEPHGIYATLGVTFSNPGALSRGSLTEQNLTRTPAVAIWNSDTGQITHHQLAAKPAEQVFRLPEAIAAKKHQLDLSNFLDSVASTRLDISSTDTVLDHVRAQHADDPALIEVIRKLLEQVA